MHLFFLNMQVSHTKFELSDEVHRVSYKIMDGCNFTQNKEAIGFLIFYSQVRNNASKTAHNAFLESHLHNYTAFID